MTSLKVFDTRFQELTKSMIEYAFEYVEFDNVNIDGVYIYCSYEEDTYLVDYFFKVKNLYKQRHKVNFDELGYNDSDGFQLEVLRAIRKDFTKIIELFKKDGREVPTQMKMYYLPKTNKFNCKLDYELHWSNTDDLLPEDVGDIWFKELDEGD